MVGVYFLPAPKAKKAREFFTQLVSPQEAERPLIMPLPGVRPVPMPREAMKKMRPPVAIPRPLPPAVPVLPRTFPTPEIPVVPGVGKEAGKPLPEGEYPKPGRGQGREGEGSAKEGRSKEGNSGSGTREGTGLSERPALSVREKLFDSGIIGDAAQKGAGNEGGSKKGDAITFDTKEYRYAGYMRKLKEKIESIWEYPPEARRKGLYGDLKIRFTIKKDGRLGAVELLRTSGYKALDDAAIKALRDGEPYWPLPDEWDMDSYTISGHFIYTMYGYGIR